MGACNASIAYRELSDSSKKNEINQSGNEDNNEFKIIPYNKIKNINNNDINININSLNKSRNNKIKRTLTMNYKIMNHKNFNLISMDNTNNANIKRNNNEININKSMNIKTNNNMNIKKNNINNLLQQKYNPIIYTMNNKYIEICKKFLVDSCSIPLTMLDKRLDCITEWWVKKQIGPQRYLKNFIPPKGWIGIGLNVLNKYDNGNNEWLGKSNCKGEWYIGYHGLKYYNVIIDILKNGFIIGKGQTYENHYNNNILTKKNNILIGKGAYFTPDIDEAYSYTSDIQYYIKYGIKYHIYILRIVLMCRINPYRVRIVNLTNNKENWVTNGTTDEVRPYRILIKFEN